MRTALILSALTTVVAAASPARAQGTRIVDEGSFTISVNGRTAGRENFRISATARGDVTDYLARADVTYGDRKLTPELRTDTQGAVVSYVVTTRSGASSEKWDGGVARGRLTANISSGRGTAAREYMVPAGALLLDDEVVHHHWFLALRSRDGSIPLVVPRQGNIQANITMSTVGQESVRIGNHDLATTHLRATVPGGDVHDVWVDASGRLLKVALPAKGLVAIRDDPPPA
jgi:hypothetical protein